MHALLPDRFPLEKVLNISLLSSLSRLSPPNAHSTRFIQDKLSSINHYVALPALFYLHFLLHRFN